MVFEFAFKSMNRQAHLLDPHPLCRNWRFVAEQCTQCDKELFIGRPLNLYIDIIYPNDFVLLAGTVNFRDWLYITAQKNVAFCEGVCGATAIPSTVHTIFNFICPVINKESAGNKSIAIFHALEYGFRHRFRYITIVLQFKCTASMWCKTALPLGFVTWGSVQQIDLFGRETLRKHCFDAIFNCFCFFVFFVFRFFFKSAQKLKHI